jgi:peptide/nickel transport system permease protein
MVLSLVGLSLIIFTLSRILPGDPARQALGPTASNQQVQELSREMGLDKPIHQQYVDFLAGLATGDLGISLESRNPVLQDILQYLPATLELITLAMFITVLVGVPLGTLSAKNKDGLVDNSTRLFAFFAVSVPSFFIAILLQLVFGTILGWLPQTGRISLEYQSEVTRETGFLLIDTLLAGSLGAHVDVWLHLVLPALALAMSPTGQVIRITRSSMIDELNKDYIEAADGYGLPGWMITYKYTLKNAFIPTATILGLLYAVLLGGAFLIELIYARGGLASYGLNAIIENDLNAVVGVTMTVGLAYVLVNFVVDIVLTQLDPRIELAKNE